MGNNFSSSNKGRQSHNDSGLHVLSHPVYSDPEPIKRFKKKMEPKIMLWVINYIFPFGYGVTVLLNIDNVKGLILFIIAVLYGIARLIFYVIKQNQDRRMRELEILEKKKEISKCLK